MSRLTRSLLLSVAAVVLGVSAFVLWTTHRAPRITRLLPEADAILYANLKPVRLATHFDRSAPPRSREFQAFVDATAIVPERDLDEVAFALTRRANPGGPNGPVAYTEIFAGRFDRTRLANYLAQQSVAQEQYAGRTIYSLASGEAGSTEPRVLRVALLRSEAIAASNAPSAEQIHGIIDRERAGIFSGTAPSLLTDRFGEVPALSPAWGIGQLGLPFAETGHVSLFGLALPLPSDQPMIASLRYLGVLRLRVVAIAPTPALAMQQTGALTGLLGLAHSLQAGQGAAAAPELAGALNSIVVTQVGASTVITADIPQSLIRQLTAAH